MKKRIDVSLASLYIGLFIVGFCGSALVGCQKQSAETGATGGDFPVFDLDRIVWSEMTPGDFDQEFIGFYRGNSSFTMETKYFKNERGDLMLENFGTWNLLNDRACTGTCADADWDCNGVVNVNDLLILMSNWTTNVSPCTSGDADGDGFVNTTDLNLYLGWFGSAGCC